MNVFLSIWLASGRFLSILVAERLEDITKGWKIYDHFDSRVYLLIAVVDSCNVSTAR